MKFATLVARNLTMPANSDFRRVATADAVIGQKEFKRQLEAAGRWAKDSVITEESLTVREAMAL
jgi:hypothetical protein